MFHEESWRTAQASVSPLCCHYSHIEINRLHRSDRGGHDLEEQCIPDKCIAVGGNGGKCILSVLLECWDSCIWLRCCVSTFVQVLHFSVVLLYAKLLWSTCHIPTQVFPVWLIRAIQVRVVRRYSGISRGHSVPLGIIKLQPQQN